MPITRRRLSVVSLQDARNRISAAEALASRIETSGVPAFGETTCVSIPEGGAAAFPIARVCQLCLVWKCLGIPRHGGLST